MYTTIRIYIKKRLTVFFKKYPYYWLINYSFSFLVSLYILSIVHMPNKPLFYFKELENDHTNSEHKNELPSKRLKGDEFDVSSI